MRKTLRKIYVRLLCLIGRAIDISSKSKFPAGDLSNFTPYTFTFRGIDFVSMEALLQDFNQSNFFSVKVWKYTKKLCSIEILFCKTLA